RPEVRDWLRALLFRVTREWGFRYVKLDFLTFGISRERSDRRTTPLAAWREALRAMREGAAPGTYFLGCDAPLAGATGLLEAIRTGPDTTWDRAKESARLAAAARRSFWRRLYALDPDVVFVAPNLAHDEAAARAAFPLVLGGA